MTSGEWAAGLGALSRERASRALSSKALGGASSELSALDARDLPRSEAEEVAMRWLSYEGRGFPKEERRLARKEIIKLLDELEYEYTRR